VRRFRGTNHPRARRPVQGYVTDYAKKSDSKESSSKPKEESAAAKDTGKEKSQDKSKKAKKND
jgi:hypothetical protein